MIHVVGDANTWLYPSFTQNMHVLLTFESFVDYLVSSSGVSLSSANVESSSSAPSSDASSSSSAPSSSTSEGSSLSSVPSSSPIDSPSSSSPSSSMTSPSSPISSSGKLDLWNYHIQIYLIRFLYAYKAPYNTAWKTCPYGQRVRINWI